MASDRTAAAEGIHPSISSDTSRLASVTLRQRTDRRNYFSIDGGLTVINTFNVVCCGDLSDWAGNTIDPFNGFLTRGRAELLSPGDLIVMDVLGYDRISAVPEPAIWI